MTLFPSHMGRHFAVDVDGTLSGNTDTKVPSQKAVKTYVDALAGTIDALLYKGVIDCSANPNYPAADAGHVYVVSVAGKIGGASGSAVAIGDLLLCNTDSTAAGTEAAVGANWDIVLGTGTADSHKVYHGIQNIGATSFSNANKTLDIAGVTIYWYKGVKAVTGVLSCDLDLEADRDHASATLTANTLYYFYFKDATGKLYWSPVFPALKETVIIATVFWNGSAGATQKEWHNHTRDLDWHTVHHLTVGARYYSGLDLTAPTTANDAALDLTTGYIYDEDLLFTLTNPTTARAWYQASAGVYTFADIARPFTGAAANDCSYLNTGTYLLTSVTAPKFVCYWVYGSGDIDRPIYIVPTQAAAPHNTVALARVEVAPNLSGVGLNPELKLLYRFIYRGDGEFQEAVDYRLSSSLPSGTVAAPAAVSVSFAPSGNIVATHVQDAIEELDTEKVPYIHGTGVLATPAISKGPAIVNSGFAGTVTATASTTVTFSSAADAILAGYHATAPVLGVTLISNALTRYIQSWTNATTCVVDTAVTWAGTAITSVQYPIAVFVDASGVVKGYMLASGVVYFVGNVGFGTSTPIRKIEFKNDTGLLGIAFGRIGYQKWLLTTGLSSSNTMMLATCNDDGSGTVEKLVFDTAGNVLFGVLAAGTSAVKVLGVGEGTAPTTSPADMAQLWSANVGGVAGKCGFHMGDEAGNSGPVGFAVAREKVKASSITLDLAECSGQFLNNYGQTADVTLTLPAAAANLAFDFVAGTTAAFYFRIDPNASDSIYLDGVTTGDGKYVGVASVALGNAISFRAFQTGASTYDWFATTSSGPWVAEA